MRLMFLKCPSKLRTRDAVKFDLRFGIQPKFSTAFPRPVESQVTTQVHHHRHGGALCELPFCTVSEARVLQQRRSS